MSLDISLVLEDECGECKCACNRSVPVYEANITHNLNAMAKEANLYYALWKPEEIEAKYAKDIIPFLKAGLKKLLTDPEHYKTFDSPNGWGTYVHFVPFVQKYLEACMQNPNAIIEVDR